MIIKNPEIQKHFVCSLVHVTSNDAVLLEHASDNSVIISADEFPFGWRVYVPVEKQNGEKKAILDEGYSKEFYKLMEIARELKCLYLCLDQDGPEYKELPKFDW